MFGKKKSYSKYIKRSLPECDPYRPHKSPDRESKRKEFLKRGGGLSGVYDISKPEVKKFVNQYSEYIPKKEIYKRDRKGNLVSVYKRPKF